MKYIIFRDEKISKLSLGTVQFGLDYGIANLDGKPSQKEINKIIDYVIDNGVNCFDTAQAYGDAESILGDSLRQNNDLFIISKFGLELFRNKALLSILESLNNLKSKSMYALLLHDSKILHEWKESDSIIVDDLLKTSKVKYFGVSIYSSEDFNLAIKNDKITFIQIPFNLFDQRAIKEQWFKRAKKYNKLILIRSIYLQGLLLMDRGKIPNELQKSIKYLKKVEELAKELKISENELAISFIDTVAQESLILFGCENINQAKENINNYKNIKKLSDFMINKIKEEFKDIDEDIYNPVRWLKWQNK